MCAKSRSCAAGQAGCISFPRTPPVGSEEVEILSFSNITAQQISGSILAIVAFLPAMVCTGYLTAWFTNFHSFRERSLVERVFWSVPLSLGVSTIACVLIGKFFTLTVVAAFLIVIMLLCIALICWESIQLRRSKKKWKIGWRPFGGTALLLAIVWIAIVVISLVDFQSGHKLFMNVADTRSVLSG